MKSNFEQSREELRRSQASAKRRKTNFILNGLIGLVILLIVIVSVSIFSGNDEGQGQVKDQTAEKSTAGSESKEIAKKDSGTTNVKQKSDSKKAASEEKEAKEEKDAENSVTVEEGGGPNVKRTITNPGWEPVESSQEQPYSSEQVDWNERVSALSQALGVDAGNMTIWYMGRSGGSANQSIGTVSAKDNPQQTYRVYLEWQDGIGWKPVKVEELIENDKD